MTQGPSAWAWGALGHRLIAETAALLLESELPGGWGPIFARHRVEMGYYAYYPDSVYRHKDPSGALEAPTHYFDLDLLPEAARRDLSSSYLEARAKLEPLVLKQGDAPVTPYEKLGSSPWRVEQFLKLASESLKGLKRLEGVYQRGTTAQGDSHKVYQALYYLGVMSHYTGDGIMPYHASADWNGWKTGQGGIHFYFENDCVNEMEPGLSADALKEARKRGAEWLKGWKASARKPAALMGAVLEDSLAAIPKVARIDLENAVLKAAPKGSQAGAKRKPAPQGCPAFRALLVERLAKGAVLTAHLWKSVLPLQVDSTGASSLQFSDFEFNPEFIAPDYTAKPASSGAPQDDGH
jgi:hypothetical protein